jgi:hypothetical protein
LTGRGPVDGYGEDLAAIHAVAFTGMAPDAARELLGRLPPRAPGSRPGLTGYLGRLRQSVSSVTMRTRW